MTPMQVHAALDTLTLLVDTREQPTARFAQRMAAARLPYTRKKLDFGDYSARCTLEDGRELDLSGSVAIERKMNLDELCQCYTRDRLGAGKKPCRGITAAAWTPTPCWPA